MNRRFFNIYQYIALLILFPSAFFLWNKELCSYKLTALVLGCPIVVSYVIPLIGTNITKFWEFDMKHKVGNIRPYHGFVFGSATSLIGLLFYKISPMYNGIINSIIFAFVCGAFLSFWNTLYDAMGVKCGFIRINNLAEKEGKSYLEVVCDYALPYFYTFGFIYALLLKFVQCFMLTILLNKLLLFVVMVFYVSALILPTFVYTLFHYAKYKCWGFWGIK